MRPLLHAISSGMLLAIGWELGKRFARILGLCLLLSVPLKAQQYLLGHDSLSFTVDTTDAPKVDKSKDWIYGVKPNLQVYDWWYQLAQCEGLAPMNAFNRIQWIVINQPAFGPEVAPHRRLWGLTIPESDGTFTIYLAGSILNVKSVVTHEMLHVLLMIHNITANHPESYFLRCEVYQGGVGSR